MSPPTGAARLLPRSGEPRIYTVSEVAQAIAWSLTDSLPQVSVQGEISNLKRHPNGHIYFDLKDDRARLRVALFRSRVRVAHDGLRDGLAVLVDGRLDFYAAKGDLSLLADRVAPVGLGALQARFDALRRALEAEGLFRPDRKRALPRFPSRIGIATSPSGAAIRDMLRILRHRAPHIPVTVAPCAVQGPGAALEVAAAIDLLNERGRVDVLIVGRGGGSAEDLWAFNEEIVVRAIARSRAPVVSAVGHESDVTLSDLAADVRAATPTHAAQLVALSRDEVCAVLDRISKHAWDRLRREIRESHARLAAVRTHHALREPERRVADGRRRTDELSERLVRGLEGWVTQTRRRLESCEAALQAHSPRRSLERQRERVLAFRHRAERSASEDLARRRGLVLGGARLLGSFDYKGVLRRGYALVWSEGRQTLVSRGMELRPDERVEVQFQDASAEARIERVRPEGKETP